MKTTGEIRDDINVSLDDFMLRSYQLGWNSVLDELDGLANEKHNNGDHVASDVILWAIKELGRS